MDIVCPECRTEYEFDDERISESGVTVKCTSCGHVFKVRRRAVVETEPLGEVEFAQSVPKDRGERDIPWMVRSASGDILTFYELGTLKQWIREGKVTRDAEISRTGHSWKVLGDLSELAVLFDRSGQPAAQQDGSGQVRAWIDDDSRSRGSQSRDEPAFTGERLAFEDVDSGGRAAWEQHHGRGSPGDLSADFDSWRPNNPFKLLLVVMLGVVVMGLGVFAATKPNRLKALLGFAANGPSGYQPVAPEIRSHINSDDPANFENALNALRVLKDSTSQTVVAQIMLIWVQHLRDEAWLLRHRASLIERRRPSVNEQQQQDSRQSAQNWRIRAEDSERRADKLLKQASAVLSSLAPSDQISLTQAVKMDLDRLGGMSGSKPVTGTNDVDKDNLGYLLYVKGMIAVDKGQAEDAVKLFGEASSSDVAWLAPTMQLALLEFRRAHYGDARRFTKQVLERNPQHPWAKILDETIGAHEENTQNRASDAQVISDSSVATATTSTKTTANTGRSTQSKKRVSQQRPRQMASSAKPKAKPKTYGQWLKVAERALKHEKTLEALDAFEKALKLRPDGIDATVGLGYAELDLQQYSNAIRRFKRILNRAPAHEEALIGLAEAYAAIGNKRQALSQYKTYLRAHPSGSHAATARKNVEALDAELNPPAQQPASPPAPPPADPTPGGESQPSAPVPSPEPSPDTEAKQQQEPAPPPADPPPSVDELNETQ